MSLPPDPTSATEAYTIEADTPCLSCGFNLRGLSSDGLCPECGSAVSLSLGGYCLRANGPDYIGSLLEGLRWWRLGVATSLIGAASYFAFPPSPVPNRMLILTLSMLSAIACLFYAVGGWIETIPTAANLGASAYTKLRALIRYGVLAGLLSAVIQFGSANLVAYTGGSAVRWVIIALFAARYIAHIAFLAYIMLQARDIPDPRLARQTRGLAILMGVWFCLNILAPAYLTFTNGFTRNRFHPLVDLVILIYRANSIINVVLHALELWLLWRFFKAFRVERELAVSERESIFAEPTEEPPAA